MDREESLFLTVSGNHRRRPYPEYIRLMSGPFGKTGGMVGAYEGVILGGGDKLFGLEELNLWLRRYRYAAYDMDILLPIAHMCLEHAVRRRLASQRPGIPAMAERAACELLDADPLRLRHTARNWMYIYWLSRQFPQTATPERRRILKNFSGLEDMLALFVRLVEESQRCVDARALVEQAVRLYKKIFTRYFAPDHSRDILPVFECWDEDAGEYSAPDQSDSAELEEGQPELVYQRTERDIVLSEEALAAAASQYTVFGRVTPGQKQLLVQALQKSGHTVAMTGDGVNDILAMKDADCSVAMASGSEAAAQAAQVVLLDSDFAHMPNVVWEGRRVVNNIQRSASLFLVKNIFSLLLALFSAVLAITYPLEPSQISLIGMFTIGLPGFLLALEPNRERIEGHFIRNVLLKALPAGLTDVLAVGALVVCGQALSLPKEGIATASTMLLAVVGFMILGKISYPFNRMKWGILALNLFCLAFSGLFLGKLFAISAMSEICILLMVVFGFAAESLFRYLSMAVEWAAGQGLGKRFRRALSALLLKS